MAASHYRNPSYPSLTSVANTKGRDDLYSFLDVLHERFNFPMPSEKTRGLPYVEKLRDLLKLGPERIHSAIDTLETILNGPGKTGKGKYTTKNLLTEFDKILEFELSTSIDFSSDRDTSVLPLLNWDKHQPTNSKRQDRHGRTSSLAEKLSQYREKLILSEDESAGGSITDIDSDDDSFHSCSDTPPLSNRVQQIPELEPASSSNLPGSGGFSENFQRHQFIENIYPNSDIIQRTSYLRSSGSGGTGRHRPRLLKQTPGTVPETHRCSNASSGYNKIGQDYISSRNSNTSVDKTRTVRASANNKPRTRTPRLSAVETEEVYNGDLDSETTDIDDVKIDPTTLSNRLSMLAKQDELSLRHLANGGSGYMGIDANGKDDDEDDIRKMAEPLEEESVSYPDSPSNREGDLTPEEDEEKAFDEVSGLPVDDLRGGLGRATITRQPEGEGARGERVPFVGPGSDLNASNDEDEDHDDDYGSIDASSEDEVMNHPALKPAAHPLPTLPFPVQWEATRVALHQKIQNSTICDYLNGFCDDLFNAEEYNDVWKILTRFPDTAKLLERTSEAIWMSLKHKSGWLDSTYLTGSVHLDTVNMGSESKIPLRITLNPLLRVRGNRFFNRFGSDRFLHLRLPSFQKLSDESEKARARIIDWLVEEELELLNRRWKCFYIKHPQDSTKNSSAKYFNQAVFFAIEGVGIGENIDEQELEALGFINDHRKLRHKMSARDLLEWHIPLQGKNLKDTVSKFWSRISLGFSGGTPTVTVNPSMIEFVNGFRSPIGEVMDDGCSIISPALMKMVRRELDSESTPTAVQARIGGAKGVWMVDPDGDWNSEELYINVKTDSQLKYEGHENDNDWARLTLDVLASSHDPKPANINVQLIPILADRGVPFSVMKELLEEHLEGHLNELFQTIDEPVQLRKWLYDHGGLARERISSKTTCMPTCGALPNNTHEIAILLLESGFSVRECQYLYTQVSSYIDQHCTNLKKRLHIRIPHSTRLLCVADPTCTLKEGEVSLRFSNGILDPKTMRRTTVILGDILVAREPAQLPSDIQKVKAVDIQDYHSPKLRELQDVIVFSVKGNRSLASLLSGGDFDGDKPWVCWDERVVASFQNSVSTFDEYRELVEAEFERSEERMEDLEPHEPDFYNRFLRIGIANSLREDFLGRFTAAWERVCYHKGISDPETIKIAIMCSFLVDAPKQGLSVRPSTREHVQKRSRFPPPAYKNPDAKGDVLRNSTNVIDRLRFVTEQKVEEMKIAFNKGFGGTWKFDPMLSELYNNESKLAKGEMGEPLRKTLSHLRDEFRTLYNSWRVAANSKCGYKSNVSSHYSQFKEIMPPKDLLKDPVISRLVLNADSNLSYWSLLRASAAHYMWHAERTQAFMWLMAGRELCFIKSQAMGRKSEFGPRTMIEEMYVPLKTSGRYQEIRKTDQDDGQEEKEEEDS
ncbi:RdRP-domain-containing protein [Morchella conica CCBAS932]|uniref:RNA-dependent RNA polymerase n=1 Tax=Morchella conica CCBAS932 TaxID=1392247 RepID=A0A3N4KD22_9PEZI|nr:RdRP-domain-containing protein [Morchella conica CCBAS932]